MQGSHHSAHGKDHPAQDGLHVLEGQEKRERRQTVLGQWKRRNHQDGVRRSRKSQTVLR